MPVAPIDTPIKNHTVGLNFCLRSCAQKQPDKKSDVHSDVFKELYPTKKIGPCARHYIRV